MDLYERLGITPEEKKLQGKDFENVVKRQYREYAKQYHPDKFQDPKEKEEAEAKFKNIAESKDVLSDPQKRKQYDMTGSTSGFNYSNFNQHADLDDILEEFLRRSGAGFGFRQRNQQPQQYKGEDATIRITLDIKDLYKGVEKKYKYKRRVTCAHCDGGSFQKCQRCQGTGMITVSKNMGNVFMQQTTTCPHCRGTGRMKQNNNNCKYCKDTGLLEEKEELITVQIPKGVTKGVVLTHEGMGHQLPKGYDGINGDLKIIISNINCEQYEVDGYNLVKYLDVPILDIITGTTIEITSPMGDKLKVEIHQNCITNHGFRFAGYGIPVGNQNRNGDLYVVVRHKFPTTLDKSDKKKIEELKTSKNFK